jgi:type I restriction enzyme R subunit
MSTHTELAFETVLTDTLLAKGYEAIAPETFDREQAIFPQVALDFIRRTQPQHWEKLAALHGEKTGERVVHDLCKWMDTYGSLATLRRGLFQGSTWAERGIGGTLCRQLCGVDATTALQPEA